MSLFTANQILAHLIGDYIFQSHWMAQNKTKSIWVATLHAITYSIPFLLITQRWETMTIISLTHLYIDHFRLARFVNWAKNGNWKNKITNTGYPEDTPAWLSTWLLIITDNILHIIINGLAIHYLG